jgi:hypothetical protein
MSEDNKHLPKRKRPRPSPDVGGTGLCKRSAIGMVLHGNDVADVPCLVTNALPRTLDVMEFAQVGNAFSTVHYDGGPCMHYHLMFCDRLV